MPYVSKIVVGADSIDLTQDTVTEESLLKGYTAHRADGTPIVGTAEGGDGLPRVDVADCISKGIVPEGLPYDEEIKAYLCIIDKAIYVMLGHDESSARELAYVPQGSIVAFDSGRASVFMYGGHWYSYDTPLVIDLSEWGDEEYEVYFQYSNDMSDGNITEDDVALGKIAYSRDRRIVGTHEEPTPSYDTPSINVSSGGLITASANGKSNTKQLTTQSAKTVTPTKSTQTAVSSGRYTTGTISVAPIPSEYIIPSGSQSISQNGTYPVTDLAEIVVDVSGGGGSSKNVQCHHGYATVSSTSYTATAVSLTVAKTGTYNVSWMGWRNTNSGTSGSQLYIGNTAYGSAQTSFVNTYGHSVKLTNVSLTQGQTITVRARSRSTSYVMGVGNLIIEEQ